MPNSASDTIAGVVRAAEKRLAAVGIDNPALEARILVAHALELDRAQLLSQSERILNARAIRHIEVLVECRARHEPIARILREREFWSLNFGLNEATLVPRPESETLIEAALAHFEARNSRFEKRNMASNLEPRTSHLRILDLGTGTGCLLLALLHELPQATGIGIDAAPRAVEQARINAEKLGLAARAEFRVNNWGDGINEKFDLVISNPPYIAHDEIPGLMPEVRDYDPHAALDGGKFGLEAYHTLMPQLPRLLKPRGIAVFEIGEGQAPAVKLLFQKSGFEKIQTRKDLGGVERCVVGFWTRSPPSRG